jgi:hypothetical protein
MQDNIIEWLYLLELLPVWKNCSMEFFTTRIPSFTSKIFSPLLSAFQNLHPRYSVLHCEYSKMYIRDNLLSPWSTRYYMGTNPMAWGGDDDDDDSQAFCLLLYSIPNLLWPTPTSAKHFLLAKVMTLTLSTSVWLEWLDDWGTYYTNQGICGGSQSKGLLSKTSA